jgi:Ti-type conjugative transfer relaxase TraA
MPIGFGRLDFVKRSQGKNMVHKSAYCGRMHLEFEGNCISQPDVYDWTMREKNFSHAILLPKHVDERFKNPQNLWNFIEKFEKRKDSQVGMDFLFALPDDKVISNEQRIEIAHKFAEKYFVSKGYGVQVDVHPPTQRKSYDETEEGEINEKNWHAHILITPRPFSVDGLTFVKKKVNTLVPEVRGGNHFAFGGIEWNKICTNFQNEYFEEKGLDLRVDQKGIIPQIHLGPIRMRSKQAYEILGKQDMLIELEQKQALDPNVILKKLTENKSIFTHSDFEIFLQKNVPETEFENVRETFWKNHQIVQLYEKDSYHVTSKFSTVEIIEEERKILRLADRIQAKEGYKTKSSLTEKKLNLEQSLAFEKIINGNSLSCIEGLAGTGKSHLLIALKNHYESNGYKVRAFGPDNATVKVLKEKGFTEASNVHRFLFKNHFSKKGLIAGSKEVWFIDEASKLGNQPLLELMKSAESNNIHLIFSGNSAQLSSVERGGMFKVFCDRYGYAFLENIQRQNSSEDREISKRLAYGYASNAVNMIESTGGFVWSKDKEESILRLVEKWSDDRDKFPYGSSLIIAHTNKEVRQINDLIHSIRILKGEVSEKEFQCRTIFGDIRVSEGDFIEFRSNHKDLKVMNGDQGILTKASEDEFIVSLNDKKVSFNPKHFNSFQLAYATTYFRSQGQTVDRAYVVYNKLMQQKLTAMYVGMTRHIRKAHCFVSRTEASCLTDLKRQLARKTHTENTLSYTTSAEIEYLQNANKRKNVVQGLCSSDDLFDRAKGYSLSLWDSVKTNVGSFVEGIQDRQSSKSFYVLEKETKSGMGHVVEVKENKLSPIIHKKEVEPMTKQTSQKNTAFKSLSEDKKTLYKNYFGKSESAHTLYTIVQSEAAAASSSKETTPSFADWQKACVERNHAAFELLRSGTQHKAILGEKGLDILRDRSAKYENSMRPKESIESQLNENLEGLLYKLFPEGPQRRDSRGFRFGCKGSVFVSCVGQEKGCYYDHERKEGGGLIKLIENKEKLNRTEAIAWASDFLKNSSGQAVPSHFSTAKFVKGREEQWISLIPPPQTPMPQLGSLSKYLEANYNLSDSYPYFNTEGNLVCYTLRLENKKDGKKIVLPLSYGKSHLDADPSWNLKGPAEYRKLLYNTPMVGQYLKKPILVVEGEKTTNSAQKLLGKDYVVVTWMGGAGAAKEADWKLLAGRDVVIWPDNDPAGLKAANDIKSSLQQVGVKSLKIISDEVLKDLPLKWDLADPVPEGKSKSFIQDSLLRAESKALGIDRLLPLTAQYNITAKLLNEVVSEIDNRLRPELEKKFGSKTWDIENSIFGETVKNLQEKYSVNDSKTNANEEISNVQHRIDKSIARDR